MRPTKDLVAGLMFVAFGAGGAAIAMTYGMGTAARMGPGYFPVVLGAAIAVLGLLIAGKALIRPAGSEPIEAGKLRPILFVSLAVLVFGFLIDARGLIVAVAALILVARLAGREGRILELVAIVAALTTVSVAIFVWGLNIPLKLQPW